MTVTDTNRSMLTTDVGRYLTFSAVARRNPGKFGGHLSPATVSRWVTRGILTKTGERVYLEVERIGGVPFTTEDKLAEFFARLNPERPGSLTREQPPAVRRKHVAAACRQLEAMGA
jgi:hypothetical protein